VPKSTIARVTQQQENLRDEWKRQQGNSQKQKREAEEAFNQWFSNVTGRGVRDSGQMLKSNPKELAVKLNAGLG
jgi:predicted  nucleic acid-binding Zn-ribbon protein